MVSVLMRELNKIVDVYNKRKLKFVFKYGILKAMWFTFAISLMFLIVDICTKSISNINVTNFILELLLRLLITIIPGIIWGIIDYGMYKDVIDSDSEKTKIKINNITYMIFYGVFGWGIICFTCNAITFPIDKYGLISSLMMLPFYGLILGAFSKGSFKPKTIAMLYNENIKGKDVKKIVKRNNNIEMRNR